MAEALKVPDVSKKHEVTFIRKSENEKLRQQLKDYFNGKDTGDERDSSDLKNRQVKVLYDEDEERKGLQLTTMLHNEGPKTKGYRDSVNPIFLQKPILTILFTMDNDYNFAEQRAAFSQDFVCVQTECLITKEGLVHNLPCSPHLSYATHLRIESCLHILEAKSIKIKTFYLDNTCRETESFVDNLYPGDEVDKSTLIVIGGTPLARSANRHRKNYAYQKIMNKIIENIKERFSKNYNLWGGELPICYSTKDLDKDGNCKDDNFGGVFGCNIYGTDVDSYSLMLESDLAPDQFNIKILNFKKNIKFQKYSIGFVNSCREQQQATLYSECMDTLQKEFSDTKFTFLLQLSKSCDKRIIGMNSEFNDEHNPNPLIGTSILMSVIIITFNDTEVQEPSSTENEYVMVQEHETANFVYSANLSESEEK